MASLGEIEESNDLVNHIGGVFRYFIVDVVDHGSTLDVARCGRELSEKFLSHEQGLNCMSSERDRGIMSLYSATSGHHNPPQVVSEHRIIDSWSPRLEEERHMKKLPSEIEETRKVKEIFGLQEKKENCWTFFAAAAQVYRGRIHESVESVEMISSYEIRAASTRKKVFGAVFDLQSQGMCDYMHWSLGFSEGFHGVLGLSLHGISVADGVLIYVVISARWYSLVSVKGVAEELKEIDSCGYVFGVTHSFLLGWICENKELTCLRKSSAEQVAVSNRD
ncbi:hypothetical protein F2Q69_00041152 [Brassica cretica]|uniref:Uncharacterized protein n=1 Tax=Brassica cretica TaxID=69181 RepID=A0A8S9NN74_BRACR|nr:hypothetical protein F2Q69_00041152 [Brassica cretica]